MERKKKTESNIKLILQAYLGADTPTWQSVVYFFMLPIASFYLLELYTHNPWQISWMIQASNYFFFLALLSLLFAIFKKQKTAGSVLISFSYILGLANYLVQSFRGTPIMPLDYKSLGTAVSVLDNYSFPWSLRLLLVSLIFISLLLFNQRMARLEIRSQVLRILGLAATTSLMIGVYSLINYPVYADMIKMDHSVSDASLMYQKNGFSLSFIRGITYLQVPEPEGYSIAKINAIIDEYMDDLPASLRDEQAFIYTDSAVYLSLKPEYRINDFITIPMLDTPEDSGLVSEESSDDEALDTALEADEIASQAISQAHDYSLLAEQIRNYKQSSYQGRAKTQPNIIVIMSEAFSELQVLADYETNTDYMPYIHSMKENTIKGYLHSSIIGGNTATSEFEFLTSDSMAFMPSGSVAYQQFVTGPMPTLNTMLEDQGYYSIAMHPYKPNGWERDVVYPYFSFDRIKFDEDFVHQDLVRDYISDEALFDEILMELEAAPADQPSFIFTVSMQNHGGYNKYFDNFEPDVFIDEAGDFEAVNQYLSLIKETDRAFEAFIQAIDALEEETIVLLFGDHQPNNNTASELEAVESYTDDASTRFIVPYLFWANYDIDEGQGQTTSLNYLAGDLLDLAGLQKSPYLNFLNDLQDRIPVITQDYFITRDGEQRYFDKDKSYETLPEDILELLNQYEILQYNHLIDSENRIEAVFNAQVN